MAANPAAGSPAPRQGRKSALRSPMTWIIILGVTVGAGAWILYRRSQANAAAASSAGTAGTGTGTDYSGEISTLQAEIADLQSSLAQGDKDAGGGTSGGGTSGGGTGDGHGGLPPGPPGVPLPPSVRKPPVPTGVHVTRVTPTSVALAWNRSPGATDYRCRVTYQGKLAQQKTASTPAITIDGLTPNHTYTFHVAASNSAGMSPETGGPVQKTPRNTSAAKTAAHSNVKAVA